MKPATTASRARLLSSHPKLLTLARALCCQFYAIDVNPRIQVEQTVAAAGARHSGDAFPTVF